MPAHSLSDFIHTHHAEIIQQFEALAATFDPVAGTMTSSELQDHAEELLTAIVADLAALQTDAQQSLKARGLGQANAMQASAHLHADARIGHRFSTGQMIAEFRALRASVLRLYEDADGPIDLVGVRRFNEAIDEALTASLTRYSQAVDRYRDQFVGVLGHDLRSPLGAITVGASLLTMPGGDEAQRARIGALILTSVRRMGSLIANLMDLTQFRLGRGIALACGPSDLGEICHSVVLEQRLAHPAAEIRWITDGDLRGCWDAARVAQVAANMIGNAVEHGRPGAPIDVTATAAADTVMLRVHNTGPTITPEQQRSIFEPMVRHAAHQSGAGQGIGLGLFIVRSIVLAHGGTVAVTSSAADGTTFDVVLPRTTPPSDGTRIAS